MSVYWDLDDFSYTHSPMVAVFLICEQEMKFLDWNQLSSEDVCLSVLSTKLVRFVWQIEVPIGDDNFS